MLVYHDAALGLRLRVCLQRAKLDREIAEGRACQATPAHALRARQLLDPRTRRRFAASLRGVVDYAERARRGPIVSAVVIDSRRVRFAREAVLGLADRLEGPVPVRARGMAYVHTLLTDGVTSPFFNPHCTGTVVQAVWEAADLLGADASTRGFDAVAL